MSRILIAALAAAMLLVAIPATVDAHRKATKRESRVFWKVVDKDSSCPIHRRGIVSTVRSRKYRWAKVVIADSTCGNGEFVLRRSRKRGAHWRIRGAGSDWGNPDRCAEDLKRIPRSVLRDLFTRSICKGF